MAAAPAASSNNSNPLLQKAARKLDAEANQQFDGYSSIRFSQCVDIKTLPDNYAVNDDAVLSTIRSGKMVSTKSYVLFYMCDGSTCYEDDEFIVDINTFTKNIASYHANYEGSICQACNKYANYCSGGSDDDGSASNSYNYNNNNYYGNRVLKNLDCDECDQYDCFSQYNKNSYNNAINNLIDDISECLRTGSYAKNGRELYVGPMCSASGDGVELALFLDNECTTYTTQKAFGSLPSYYMYSNDYVFEATKESFQKAFSETTSCADSNIGNPYNQANDDGANDGEMNAYCQQVFDGGGAISLSSCSADDDDDDDDQNSNYYYSNQNGGNYGGDDFLGWYTYDMTINSAQDINEVCSTVSQMGGSYNNYYNTFKSGTWYSKSSSGKYYLDAGSEEKAITISFITFFLFGAIFGGIFLYKKQQEKLECSKRVPLNSDTFDSIQTVGIFT